MKADDTTHPSILIIDDDELVRKSLRLFVSSFHCACHVTDDGPHAVRLLQSHSFDLVLTDIKVPGMNGSELLHYIVKHSPKTKVIVTGHDDPTSHSDAIEAGATEYIQKPIDQIELEAKIINVLQEKIILRKSKQSKTQGNQTPSSNKEAFDAQFRHEVEKAQEHKYPIFLAKIYINHFKKYTDNFGKRKGDEILETLGKMIIEGTESPADLCFRIGGREFAAILPQVSGDEATEIIQRILLPYVERGFDSTSLSIGVSSCRRDPRVNLEDDLEKMKDRADQAMRFAQKDGDNTVICWV